MLFNPTRDQARQFFIEAWRKRCGGVPASALETIAADVIAMHPEYHALLVAADALTREWTPEDGAMNPFLHLSLHLAIAEQLSIDQPPGIRALFETRRSHHGNVHDALHDILDCLGETIWRAQRERQPPDGAAYLDCIRRKAG
ncbi:DUF1841 family protein [Sulfuricystis multivorans]|uniref:DUF1841 family protein n=1 Tax=Sulfuricystis multivorans TaxID=2211108 RepID=UPI000F820D99|nr:DUF1841 family protein [Sulfuricystis multivorans]